MSLSVSEISSKLAMQAERVVAHLIPGGKLAGGEWVCGDISGGPGESLKIALQGQHSGSWRDWADNDTHGDLIDLWRLSKSIPAAEAIRQAKDFLGISDPITAQAQKVYGLPTTNGTKPLSATGMAMDFLVHKRKLEPAIVNLLKIQGTAEKRAIVFPCYNPEGNLINRSYRTLPKDGEKKEVWQDKGCAPCIFGWHALPEAAYASKTVLLCEGQIDCATWTQWGIPALSIPNGSGGTWIDYEWENLAAFDKIYISFDMDGSGADNAQKAIQRLGKHRCFIVSLPHKDANDCLIAGCTAEDAAKWITEAKAPTMNGLVLANDLKKRIEKMLLPQPPYFTLPFFKIGKEDGFYFRPSEVTVWTGITSTGKSTFLRYLMLSLASFGKGVFSASMETKAEKDLFRIMCGFYNHTPVQSEIEGFLEECGHLIAFADVAGYISQDSLFEMMQFAQRRYGMEHFFIDSLMRVEGLEEEYVQQGKFLNRLAEFAGTSGAHIHLVAHPRKMPEDGKPKKQDVKGSSLIPNNADNIIAICRNNDKEKMRKDGTLKPEQARLMHDCEVIVEKQRDTGWEGRFLLTFNPKTYSYGGFSV